MSLRPDQVKRYARHLYLPEVGAAGQERLLAAAVRLEGRGAALALAAEYLTAAGVGTLIVPASAAEDLRARAAELNPDVSVRESGDAAVRVDAGEAADAFDALERGAAAAAQALREILS